MRHIVSIVAHLNDSSLKREIEFLRESHAVIKNGPRFIFDGPIYLLSNGAINAPDDPKGEKAPLVVNPPSLMTPEPVADFADIRVEIWMPPRMRCPKTLEFLFRLDDEKFHRVADFKTHRRWVQWVAP